MWKKLNIIDLFEITFKNFANYTEIGCLFIFDINTKYRYEHCYGSNDFVLENDNGVLVWQNHFYLNRHTMELMYFLQQDNGQYKRFDEVQHQRYFSPQTIKKLLLSSGFEVVGCFGTTDFGSIEKDSEKIYYITRRIALS